MTPEGWHVYPMGDLREHITDQGGNCWCNPVPDEDEPAVWVHNSLDGREKYETGELRPQ